MDCSSQKASSGWIAYYGFYCFCDTRTLPEHAWSWFSHQTNMDASSCCCSENNNVFLRSFYRRHLDHKFPRSAACVMYGSINIKQLFALQVGNLLWITAIYVVQQFLLTEILWQNNNSLGIINYPPSELNRSYYKNLMHRKWRWHGFFCAWMLFIVPTMKASTKPWFKKPKQVTATE